MSVESWRDIPEHVAAHHHCVASVERHHDPRRWVDASATRPDLVAWTVQDATEWIRHQLTSHLDGAAEAGQQMLTKRLDTFRAVPPWDAQFGPGLPTFWERLHTALAAGRWCIEAFQLGPGRKLVLQLLTYADWGQPVGDWAACRSHRPPLVLAPKLV